MADLGIALACLIIAIVYIHVCQLRKTVQSDPFLKRLYWGYFGVFACGAIVFFLNIITFWLPIYSIQVFFKWVGLLAISFVAYGLMPNLAANLLTREQQIEDIKEDLDEMIHSQQALMEERRKRAVGLTGVAASVSKIRDRMKENPNDIGILAIEMDKIVEDLKAYIYRDEQQPVST